MDENDDEEWRSWESKPVDDLSLALPDEWPLFFPIKIAPEFLDWFRENYEIACSRQRKDLIVHQQEYPHREWMRLLYGKPEADHDLFEKQPEQTFLLDTSCYAAPPPDEERPCTGPDREESDPMTVTLFSWGYYGWGNHTHNLVEAVDAVEKSRGFKPPFFVDARIRRSVRAIGFKGTTFEKLLGEQRHEWDKRLGNLSVVTGTGPPIQIANPSAVEDLLDLAIELARHKQRIIFFCSCKWPREGEGFACHRTEVARLVLEEAKERVIRVEVEEWPGGEPERIELDLPPEEFIAVKKGRWTVRLGEEFDLARFAGLPWCSIATLHSGGETLYRIVGPAICQTSGWALPILWRADDPNAGLREYEAEVSGLRREWGLEAALSY